MTVSQAIGLLIILGTIAAGVWAYIRLLKFADDPAKIIFKSVVTAVLLVLYGIFVAPMIWNGYGAMIAIPLAAVRSVPTITQLTFPRCMKCPAMLSVMSVTGMRSFFSSQAVSRAPCRKGRVSHAITWIFLPASTAARTTPRAVP